MDTTVKAPAVHQGSLAEQAYRAIRDRLILLEIRPGEPINEDALTRSLEVGRTPVREALKRLASERLVVAYPRRGTFATDVNIADLRHISEVRHSLEPLGAAAAAERATDADRGRLDALLGELSDADGTRASDELMRLDLRAHRAVYDCTHNPFLQDTLVRYDNLATRIWCVFLPRLSGMTGHVAEHVPLVAAILDGFPDKARQLAEEHVSGFEQSIRALV
ncbi:MAG: GntR family transcriptional regulator [Streptosporangiales bacterium]|nr:GntR family transcriptional regulator [Streptosporangiales bacterium]MBO0889581.1 GntR family transcriptional regulator [Acidothermales bacterium]